MRKNAAARVHAAKWQREKTEGANFCGGAKNDPHAGGGSSTAQSAAGALASCILANRLGSRKIRQRRTQNEGGYISVATPAHHHGARWREQVLPQCSLVSKMAKLPGGVCYWVRIYKYIRALKQSARERHCIAKTGFTPLS